MMETDRILLRPWRGSDAEAQCGSVQNKKRINMDKEQQFCQSCGMPLTPEILGTNVTCWGNQVEKGDGRCFGIACDEHYILVSEYGKDGADAEIVILKRR
ncbi:MAG: hypothetical protein K5882_04270 [Bacteroidales bacterium]|nr:hypothetical protein [Bacteroidales bacterium]